MPVSLCEEEDKIQFIEPFENSVIDYSTSRSEKNRNVSSVGVEFRSNVNTVG